MTKYTVGTRASILQGSLTVEILHETQLTDIITALLKAGYYNFSVSEVYGDTTNPKKYMLNVTYIWAANLKELAEILYQYDYDDEG